MNGPGKNPYGAALLSALATVALAEQQPLSLVVTGDAFSPSELQAPSGIKLQVAVTNQTRGAIEFESFELNRERVIQAGQTVTVYLSPLDPGRYEFFDDFHQERRGTLVVK